LFNPLYFGICGKNTLGGMELGVRFLHLQAMLVSQLIICSNKRWMKELANVKIVRPQNLRVVRLPMQALVFG